MMDAPRDHKWLSVQSRCPLDLLDRLPSVDVDMPRTLDNMIGYDVATVVVAAWKQFRRRHRVVA
jgi:Na+/H+-dicarboxylate symporter